MAAARALIARIAPLTVSGLLALSACKGKGEEAGSEEATNAEVADADAGDGPTHAPEVAAAIEQGHALFFGKAVCSTCHKVGDEGAMIVGPNLGVGDGMEQPFALRVSSRGEAVDPATYVIDSILDPNAVVVPGYARSVMKSPDDIPIDLSDDELVALAAFIMSIGATSPIEPAALERARAHIPVARTQRQARE